MSDGIRVSLEGMPSDASIGWIALAPSVDVNDHRNRLIFTVIYGNPWDPSIRGIAPPRGLPSDVTHTVRALYEEWGTLASVASWISLAELRTAVERISDRAVGTSNPGLYLLQHLSIDIQAILAYLEVYSSAGYATRIVFWFTDI